jgi:hypothetical protein
MARRGNETDPLEVIIAQRRLIGRVFIVGLIATFLPSLSRMHPGGRVGTVAWPRSPAIADLRSTVPPAPAKKMSPTEAEARLRAAPAAIGTPGDLHCGPGHNGWDYICSYRSGPGVMATRLQIGLRVAATEIVQASVPYTYGSVIPRPTPLPGAP